MQTYKKMSVTLSCILCTIRMKCGWVLDRKVAAGRLNGAILSALEENNNYVSACISLQQILNAA